MARSFNGTSDKALVGANKTNLKITGAISGACWMFVTTLAATDLRTLFALGYDGSTTGYVFGFNQFGTGASNNTGKLMCTSLLSGAVHGSYSNTDFSQSGNKNKWFHVGFSWDTSAWHTWVNGVEESNAQGTGGTGPQSNASSFEIGSLDITGSPGRFFAGRIAEACVWNVSLAANEWAALAGGANTQRVRPGSIAGCWPLWGLQSPEPDLSGNAYNGTLTGTALANHAPLTTWTKKAVSFPFGIPNAFTVSVTDAPATSESVARANFGWTRTAVDAPLTSESVRKAASLRVVDSPAATEAVARAATLNRSATEAVSTNGSVARTEVLSRTAADAPLIAEATSRVGVLVRSTADSPQVAESLSRATSRTVSATDAPLTSEATGRVFAGFRTATDSPSITETVTRGGVLNRLVTDAVHVADQESQLLLLDTFTDVDGTLLTDHTPEIGGPWLVADGGGLTTSCSILSNQCVNDGIDPSGEGNITDVGNADVVLTADVTFGGEDDPSSFVVFFLRGLTSSSTLWSCTLQGGPGSPFTLFNPSPSQIITINTNLPAGTWPVAITCAGSVISATVNGGHQITVANAQARRFGTWFGLEVGEPSVDAVDNLTITSIGVTRALTAFRSVNDFPLISEATAAAGVLHRTVANAVQTSEATATLTVLARTISDQPLTSESVARQPTTGRNVADQPLISEATFRAFAGFRTINDASMISEVVSSSRMLAVGVADSPAASESIGKAFFGMRAATDSPLVGEVASRMLAGFRGIVDAPMTSEVISGVKVLSVAVADHPATSEALNRVVLLLRGTTDAPRTVEVISIVVVHGVPVGPFFVEAGQVFMAGMEMALLWIAGAEMASAFISGAEAEGEFHPGAEAGGDWIAGADAGEVVP